MHIIVQCTSTPNHWKFPQSHAHQPVAVLVIGIPLAVDITTLPTIRMAQVQPVVIFVMIGMPPEIDLLTRAVHLMKQATPQEVCETLQHNPIVDYHLASAHDKPPGIESTPNQVKREVPSATGGDQPVLHKCLLNNHPQINTK